MQVLLAMRVFKSADEVQKTKGPGAIALHRFRVPQPAFENEGQILATFTAPAVVVV